MSDLPNWVYDVVIELQRWSDEHPQLYTSTGGVEGYVRVEDCGCKALDHVPAEVRDRAKAIAVYQSFRFADPPSCICQRVANSGPDGPILVTTHWNPDCPAHPGMVRS